MRVSSPDCGGSAVDVPSESDLFGSGFAVEVRQHRVRPPVGRLRDYPIEEPEWVVSHHITEHPPQEVYHKDRFCANSKQIPAFARHARWVVGRSDDDAGVVGVGEHVEDVLPVPEVVAGGEEVDSRLDHLVDRLGRNALALRQVFAVTDDEVRLELIAKTGKRCFDRFPAYLGDDVSEDENLHASKLLSFFTARIPRRASP
ncbi:MAG: hypothetical protein WC483_05610 [Candidatus Paceibacterota bacterium]